MNNVLYYFAICLSIFLLSCDGEKFKTVDVSFCKVQNIHHIIPAKFETKTGQVLLKAGYNEGATFETRTELVIIKDAYTTISIPTISIVVSNDAESNTTIEIPCCHDPAEAIITEVGYDFIPRTYQWVVENGTGPEVEAEYGTMTYEKLVEDARLEIIEIDSVVHQETFTIPEDMDFDDYWNEQLVKNIGAECKAAITYEVIE